MVGQTIGKYRVVSRLGRGGMGTVYKAVDETLDREVAIKSLNHDLSETDVLKRFRAEAITLARLNHPNIATLFELTEHEGNMLMVMEFVRGETFEKVSDRLGALGVSRAVELCTQVLDALAHAHRAGIVHRDLKPANLMLAESGIVKVMDFGLARMAGSEHLTNDGYMVGTPAYMSPEQVLGGEVDGRADLYAMGVVLYRLLTGQLPFKAESGIAMVQKQMYDQPTPVRQLRVELPFMCEELFERALAKAPDARYQTADEFKSALATLNACASSEITRTMATPAPSPILIDASMEPTTKTPSGSVRPPSGALPISRQVPVVTPPPVTPAPAPSALSSASSASAVPVPPPASVAAVPARKPPFAALAAGVLLLAAVPTSFYLWRGRDASPAPSTTATASSATPASAPAAPPPAASTPPASTSASTSPTSASIAPPSAPSATPAESPKPASTTAVSKAAPTTPASVAKAKAGTARPPDTTPATSPAAPPPSTPALAIVTFPKMKYLSVQDGKARDRDASLRLAGDALQVIDGKDTIQSAPYSDIIAVFHSHAKEPKWSGPDGTVLPVAKVGGKFGFLKGTPDWITVRTRTGFIPLRVDDDDLKRVIAELEARTGTKVVRTK